MSRPSLPAGAWLLLVSGGVGLLVILVVAGAMDDPRIPHTSALNAVLDSRILIAAARVVIGVALAYLLLSIVVRVSKNQWVRGAAGVQTDQQPAQALANDQADLQLQLREAQVTIDDLTQRLGQSLSREREHMATMEELRGRGSDPARGEGHHDRP